MDQIPRMAELLTPAVDVLLGDLTGDRRRARERYAQSGVLGGRYGDILRGWRAQAEVVRARLSKEVLATRLDGCSGQDLKDLAKSEYFAEIPDVPQKAVGQVVLIRHVTNTNDSPTGNFSSGVVPAGTRVRVSALPTALYPLQDAEYVTTQPLQWIDYGDSFLRTDNGDGTWTHIQLSGPILIEATREGPHANMPLSHGDAVSGVGLELSLVSTLFDSTFSVYRLAAAGGTLGTADVQIRALARAMSNGRNGPTAGAVVAGALSSTSVRHVAYVETPDAPSAIPQAVGRLYVADESWAYSEALGTKVDKLLRAYPWIGWGCRVQVFGVRNTGVTVVPTIVLRSPEYVTAQADITAAIAKAAQSYFDDRPDWYTWTLNALGAVCGGADDRILACIAVSVLNEGGTLIASVDSAGVITGTEPPSTIVPEVVPENNYATHYALIRQTVSPNYQVPG